MYINKEARKGVTSCVRPDLWFYRTNCLFFFLGGADIREHTRSENTWTLRFSARMSRAILGGTSDPTEKSCGERVRDGA